MGALFNALEELTSRINSSSSSLEFIGKWIDGYRGKVIQFVTPEETCHLVFTKEGVSLRRGEYPSVDVTIEGEEGVLLDFLRGKEKLTAGLKSRRIITKQNLHEAFRFEALLSAL